MSNRALAASMNVASTPVLANDLDDKWLGEPIEAMLPAVIDPKMFWMAITQVNIKRRVGSIIIPDTVVSDQEWTNGLGLVVKVGPSVYKGRRFEDIDADAERFVPGDIVYFKANTPYRHYVDGRLFLYITDDSVMGTADRNELHRIKFTI